MALTQATGGDGWSTWTVRINHERYDVQVVSKTETVVSLTPAGWAGKLLAVANSMPTAAHAIDYAERVSAEYAHRMSV